MTPAPEVLDALLLGVPLKGPPMPLRPKSAFPLGRQLTGTALAHVLPDGGLFMYAEPGLPRSRYGHRPRLLLGWSDHSDDLVPVARASQPLGGATWDWHVN